MLHSLSGRERINMVIVLCVFFIILFARGVADECKTEGFCSQFCDNQNGSYVCSCMEGYQLINRTCSATGAAPILLFATLKEIRAFNLRTEKYHTIHNSVKNAAIVAVDPLESRVYWNEFSDQTSIYSSKLDGSDVSSVVTNGLLTIEDVAVDYVAKNLYLTDSYLKQVLVCKMDGSMCLAIHKTEVDKPRGIAIDPSKGLLYWTDWGNHTAGIYRSGMDGSDRVTLVSEDIVWPNRVAIDHATNRLYWCDANAQTIEFITLDSQIRKVSLWIGPKVITLSGVHCIIHPINVAIDCVANHLYWSDVVIKDEESHPYSLAVFEDFVYWSDWRSLTIKSTNKFTGHIIHVMTKSLEHQIMGINIYHPVLATSYNNPCQNNTCSHMCLIASMNSHRCACATGYRLDSNGWTCLVEDTYPMLFTHDRTRVYRILYEAAGNKAVDVLPFHFESVGGLAFDWESKILFISDTSSSVIYSVDMTTFRRRILLKNLTVPESLAFDFESGNLYWVDSRDGKLGVISSKTLKSTTLITQLYSPRNVVLMPDSGHMFVFSDTRIMRFDMDGKNGMIIKGQVGYTLTVLARPSTSLLYWADRTISSIDYSNADFLSPVSEPRVLVEKVGEEVTSLAVNEKYLFWTENNSHALHLKSFNHSYSLAISVPVEKVDEMIRGVIYASAPVSRRPAGESPCSKNNGGCSYLCLTSPTHRSCACPDDRVLSVDGKSCIVCEGYTCPMSGECIPWTKVCDGEYDCTDQKDERLLCDSSCSNGSCSQICQKTRLGSKCSCYEGYFLSQDGITCEDINECDNLGRCSHFCNNTKGGFECSCAQGYNLETDQRTCKAVGGEAYLVYLFVDAIRGLNLETHSRHVYFSKNFAHVKGMGYDSEEGIFFWSGIKSKTIESLSIDSANLGITLKTDQEPLLLRRDWITKNLFYTTEEGSIVCCNRNGSYCTSVIKNVSSRISGFDISPIFGFIFWSASRNRNHNSVIGAIERANMDGSFREVIVSENIFFPTAIAVDPVLETIYWCDSVLNVLESTDFSGFQRRKIVDHLQYPISLTVFEDYIYWSDRATNSLSRCNKFSGKDIVKLLTAETHMKFLTIVHNASQMHGKNRCADSNCSQICVPTGKSFVCKCDDHNLTDTSKCESNSSSSNQSCPEDYCFQNADCVVYSDSYVCRCPLHFTGERCEKSAQAIQRSKRNLFDDLHPVWFVCGALVLTCVCLFAILLFFCQKYRRFSTKLYFGSTVQFVNTGSFQGSCETIENIGKDDQPAGLLKDEHQAVIIM